MKVLESNQLNIYQEKWESRSSIRTRPRKFIDFTQSGYFFPEDKQPILLDKHVINLGEKIKQDILLQSFYKYLSDIINLESKLIISACNKLIHGDLIVKYTDEIVLNSHTIIIDEYYHIYVARDMMLQLDKEFPGVQKCDYSISDAYNAVEVITKKLDVKYHDIFEIIAVCIFETTLVRELVEFFNAEDVHPSIKYYVNDHMNDEARHYGFFFDLLSYTWVQLPPEYQKNIGELIADFVKLYLNINSEKAFNFGILLRLFPNQNIADQIIKELYKGFDINTEIPIVKNVLNVLSKSTLLDNEYVKRGFQDIGWSV